MLNLRFRLIRILVCWLGLSLAAVAAFSASAPAVVQKLQLVPLVNGFDLSIICTQPVVPVLHRLPAPERLVVDLPNTLVGTQPKVIPVVNNDVKAVRIHQYQQLPPVTRIVFDLQGVRDYSYETHGATLLIHVVGIPAPAGPIAVAIHDPDPSPALVPVATPVSRAPLVPGSVMVAGVRIAPGSAVTAGGETTILHLGRGGEVHVCAGTTVSATPSENGRDLMLGMSGGALELHYALAASSDTVLTPDFRILFTGPGEFHYAVSADAKGDTCVRTLAGNTAAAVVTELMGDGSYQVKPLEQVIFRGGRIGKADAAVPLECGCPLPPSTQATQMAALVPAGRSEMIATTATRPAPMPELVPVKPGETTPASQTGPNVVPAEGVPLPPEKPDAIHVQVEAPFVFRAEPATTADASRAAPPSAAPAAEKSSLETVAPSSAPPAPTPPAVQTPEPVKTKSKPAGTHDLASAIKNFFRRIFR